ncbi:MFS transporter [Talaromyces pinophilus]|uniref:MFS transporter n=1 Tax=Talaromyces pinophilus TaxID=128442 RepID=A0A478ECF3_TALPI|nr:MFS transporter [Talaromyces pinophilus]
MSPIGPDHDWRVVRPDLKWQILRRSWRFFLWAMYSSVGSMMLGYDFGAAGTCTAFPSFVKQFGEPFEGSYLIPARVQSGWSGASTAGDILGVLAGGYLIDVIGRMQQGASGWQLFLVGRLISAFGFGIVFVNSPVWIGEVVRPELRGFFLCIMNGSIVLAQFILSCTAQGTSKINNDWSWKIIIILQYMFVGKFWDYLSIRNKLSTNSNVSLRQVPLIVFYPFFPESPYYLLKNNKNESARNSLEKIWGKNDQELINAEMERIQANVEFSEGMIAEAKLKGPLIVQAFQGINRKRSLIAMIPPAGQQMIGSAFVLTYITYFLELIGVTNYFLVSLILYIVMLISNLSAFFVVEVSGRRKLLVPGMIVLTLICLIMGIMGCLTSKAAFWVSIVCIFLWAVFYQITIGAIGFALSSEVGSLPLRPVTQSIVGVTQGVTGWVMGFVTPYIINPDEGNMGAKIGFVFFGLGIIASVLVFLYVPETKGLNFDEIDYLFASGTNPRRFQEAIAEYRARGQSVKKEDLAPKSISYENEKEGIIVEQQE